MTSRREPMPSDIGEACQEFGNDWQAMRHVRDLFYDNGPVLREYAARDGTPWLACWCDGDDQAHRWLAFPVGRDALVRYLAGEVTLRSLVVACDETFLVDVDRNDRPWNPRRVARGALPAYYLLAATMLLRHEAGLAHTPARRRAPVAAQDVRLALRIHRLPHAADLPLPRYETADAAGMDLRAALGGEGRPHTLVLAQGERQAVPTGLVVAVPRGFEGQVRARSGRAMREGLAVLNAPGTIDADYRGEVLVLLVNLGKEPVTVRRAERIAQFVIAPVVQPEIVEAADVADLGETSRGAGGLGSTGR
jgi:dUTP pyrophosphatase